MNLQTVKSLAVLLGAVGMVALSVPASAEIVLSQVIIDLPPNEPPRQDIEVWNNGDERAYVSAEPAEIQLPGTDREVRLPAGNPDTSGLLVTPRRVILEPGERRVIRVAYVGDRQAADRVYRLAVKPVAGLITAKNDALKVFVGYDALVLVRPENREGDIVAERQGNALTLRNESNTAQEVFQGRQCNASQSECYELPSKRLYPGTEWRQILPFDAPVSYKFAVGPEVRERRF